MGQLYKIQFKTSGKAYIGITTFSAVRAAQASPEQTRRVSGKFSSRKEAMGIAGSKDLEQISNSNGSCQESGPGFFLYSASYIGEIL
jgi:hypothetical protein